MQEVKRDSVSLYRFKKTLREIGLREGYGTQLISLYIPPDKQVFDVINYLRQEYGTAANIKSKSTRKNVQEAIERAIQRLKLLDKVPKTGIVIFSGAIPTNGPGTERIEVHQLVPPEPVQAFIYSCDSKFIIEPLKEMVREKDIYGVMVLDNEEAAIAVAKGNTLPVIKTFTSGVPGKHRAGGQSARRFERLREASLNDYYKRVADHANELFLSTPGLKDIIVAGPGPTKEDFVKAGYLHYSFKDKIHIVDASYSGESGIREAIAKSSDILKELRLVEEQKLVQRFMQEISKENGLAVYGLEKIREKLLERNVEVLLISENLDLLEVTVKCDSCGFERKSIVEQDEAQARIPELLGQKCSQCQNQTLKIANNTPLIDVLIEEAEQFNAKVELISSTSEEGEMLKKSFGGAAAILRH